MTNEHIAYSALAEYYDRLTFDVDYAAYANRADKLFKRHRIPGNLVLDLACGTGSLTVALAQMGYDMISCDSSPEMLHKAREKATGLDIAPTFICQDMTELDLYGTVDGCVCGLDSLNYLTDGRDLKRAVSLVSLFMNKGGVFIFDVKSPGMFEDMAGTSAVCEIDDIFAVWQYGYDKRSRMASHTVDIFAQKGSSCQRYTETHFQRAYTREAIEKLLTGAGFSVLGVYSGTTNRLCTNDSGRLMFVAQK